METFLFSRSAWSGGKAKIEGQRLISGDEWFNDGSLSYSRWTDYYQRSNHLNSLSYSGYLSINYEQDPSSFYHSCFGTLPHSSFLQPQRFRVLKLEREVWSLLCLWSWLVLSQSHLQNQPDQNSKTQFWSFFFLQNGSQPVCHLYWRGISAKVSEKHS